MLPKNEIQLRCLLIIANRGLGDAISEKLKDMGYKIDKKCIKSDVAISSLGVTKVSVELHKKVKFDLNVELVK